MDKIKDNKGTPTKGSSTKNGMNSNYNYHTDDSGGDKPDIDQPNSSNATPEIPVEMPAREVK